MLTNEELDDLNNIRKQIEALRLRHEHIIQSAATRRSVADGLTQPTEKTEVSSVEPQSNIAPTQPDVAPEPKSPSVDVERTESNTSKQSKRKGDPDSPTVDEIEAESKGTQYWHADRDEAPLELPSHIPLKSALELMTNACCGD